MAVAFLQEFYQVRNKYWVCSWMSCGWLGVWGGCDMVGLSIRGAVQVEWQNQQDVGQFVCEYPNPFGKRHQTTDGEGQVLQDVCDQALVELEQQRAAMPGTVL